MVRSFRASSTPAPAAGPDPGYASPPPYDEDVFSARVRLVGTGWFALALVITAVAATLVDGPPRYLIVMSVTSGLFTIPAGCIAAVASRRVDPALRPLWAWYMAGNVIFYLVGAGLLNYGLEPRVEFEALALGAATVAFVCDILAIDQVVRSRSGARSRLVDLVESSLAIVMVGAPVVVVTAGPLTSSPYAWFAVLIMECLVLFISALWCSVVLFVRSPAGKRRAAGVGIVMAAVAVVDAVVQIQHVASGFALSNPLVLTLNGLSMGLLLLVPLHARRGHAQGLEQLPPHEQIRTGRVVAAVTFLALPVLVASVLATGTTMLALHVAGGALALLVALSAARQLLTFSETRRLYAQVERSAEERRVLLGAVLESMDAERRRVAMQLHEQASSSYAALATLAPADEIGARVPGEAWSGRPVRPLAARPLSRVLTERMAAQAESLRALIGAIHPMSAAADAGLVPILRAYVDSLDDTVRPRHTTIEVAEDLRLDWITETIALRVVQEAVRNTCRHASATALRIGLGVEDGIAVVRVSDDGAGFDVEGLVVESGIATMRRFVSFCDGQLRITSAFGGGTTVEARLGGAPRVPEPVRLRPVT